MSEFPVFNQWVPVDGCSGGGGGGSFMLPIAEAVSVTSINGFAPLSQTPANNAVTLSVNGRSFFPVGSPPDFSIAGNAITWLSTEYSVSPGDDVVAIYFYMGSA